MPALDVDEPHPTRRFYLEALAGESKADFQNLALSIQKMLEQSAGTRFRMCYEVTVPLF